MAKAPTWLESCAVILYCAFLYQQITRDESVDETYARLLRFTSTVCRRSAQWLGLAGIKAELEYHRIVEAGRMN